MELNQLTFKSGTSDDIINDVQFLHKTIWGLDDLEMTPSHIYIATEKNGGVLLCAYYKGQPVGFVFGFPGIDEQYRPYYYSHNLGVLKDYRNQNIGYLLKVKLREILLEKGFLQVYWTFEPLDSKNAYSYIRKLGCISNIYKKEYYGKMRDSINYALPSDRLIMDWRIKSDHVQEVLDKKTIKLTIADIDPDAMLNNTKITNQSFIEPLESDAGIDRILNRKKSRFYLEIPSNYNDLKSASVELASKWRMHVRKILMHCFQNDFYITGAIFEDQRFFYVIQPISQIKI